MYRKRRRESVAGESGRFEESERQVVARLRAGCESLGNAAAGLARKRALGQLRGAPSRLAVHRGPAKV